HSLFEEQIEVESLTLDRYLDDAAHSYAEAQTYFPDMNSYNIGPDAYLEHIRKAKERVRIPVIASLNGVSLGGWLRYAALMQEAGADALELNIYNLPTDPDVDGETIEENCIDLVRQIRKSIQIPLAVKLGPFFSSIPNVARQLDQAGAGSLVLFNRFYQPDLDLQTLEVVPSLTLSNSSELLLRLHWVAILHRRIKCDLAITGGVHTGIDVLKSMMAGATVAMMTSALLLHGVGHALQVESDMRQWMEEHEYESVRQMIGSMSYRSVADASAYERGNYMKVLSSYTLRSPAARA
ncbi:MAG: dihydroorotate dehydrogenase-like protein, partial [Bryobacterales bacterium]|nr:dihydroorotate dehydrogenase-like protein [Bryobacterales bacterium]